MSEKNVFDKFASIMDQNVKGVQYGVYAIAGTGLLIALRSVRPFKKFKKPNDIPKEFIDKRMKFSGKVVKINGGSRPILAVDHYPVLTLPFFNNISGLPLQISSVDVAQNGGTWLSVMLVGSEITFIPLRTDSKKVQAIIYLKNKNVGEHLVSIGFATVGGWDTALDDDKLYGKYYKELLAAERLAERRGAGVWLGNESFLWRLWSKMPSIRVSTSKSTLKQ